MILNVCFFMFRACESASSEDVQSILFISILNEDKLCHFGDEGEGLCFKGNGMVLEGPGLILHIFSNEKENTSYN